MSQPTVQPRPLTHTSPDVYKLRGLTPEERDELRARGVRLDPPLVRAIAYHEEDNA